MKPLLIFGVGFLAIWALQRQKQDSAGQGAVLPQQQRGIPLYQPQPTPQYPMAWYSSWGTPPLASTQGGFVPPFGPYYGAVDPNSLYWNQA